MTILSDVKALGQQIWLDNLSRSLVQSGELAEMLKNCFVNYKLLNSLQNTATKFAQQNGNQVAKP